MAAVLPEAKVCPSCIEVVLFGMCPLPKNELWPGEGWFTTYYHHCGERLGRVDEQGFQWMDEIYTNEIEGGD
jgi:hypothetical protein